MADLKEIAVKITWETDEAGLKKAKAEIVDLGNALKGTGDESRQAVKSIRSLGEDVRRTTRLTTMGGMAFMNMAMVLGSTGVISQKTSQDMALLGAAVTSAGAAMNMVSQTLKTLAGGFTLTTGVVGAAIVGIAAIVYAFQYFQNEARKARGEYKDLGEAIGEYKGNWTDNAKNVRTWIENQRFATGVAQNFKIALESEFPALREYRTLTEDIAKKRVDLNIKSHETSEQRKIVDILQKEHDLKERIINDEKSLKRAREDLAAMTDEGADLEKDLAAARVAAAKGLMSGAGLRSAERAASSFKSQREELEGRVSEGEKTLKEDKAALTAAEKQAAALGVTNVTLESAQAKLTTMEGDLSKMEDETWHMEENLRLVSEKIGPELLTLYGQIDSQAAVIKQKYDGWVASLMKAREEAQMLAALRESGGESAVAMYGQAGGGGVIGLQEGTPYVSKTGLALLHKGEAVVPANQNTFADSLHIGNVSLGKGYGFDAFLKDRERRLRIKRKMAGF